MIVNKRPAGIMKIRTAWSEEENRRYYAVNDVVKALTGTIDAVNYIKKMRNEDKVLAENWKNIVKTFPLETLRGIKQINCANAEGLIKLINSIPSPKADKFKTKLRETDNPEQLFETLAETAIIEVVSVTRVKLEPELKMLYFKYER